MSKVKVAVRVRPINRREIECGSSCVVDMEGNQTVLESKKRPLRTFAFDHCFWTLDPNNPKYHGQKFVFDALGLDILDNAFEGYNACIFAYGQTGSGKSFTMMGSGRLDEQTKGIIPRLCDTLFARIDQNEVAMRTHKVEVSYMEIYCEKVHDLLSPKGSGKHTLKVREHKSLGPYVENLSKLAVRSFKEINDIMSEGNKSRTVAATQMNAESSRSHAVFSILLTQMDFDPKSQTGIEKVSKISLVDLAGSERVSKTGALGDRLKEGSNINKSLSTLGLVISALADISAGKKPKNAYIPYRDSILTWLLKDNLGGNSKTVMIATISPSSDSYEETLSTLRYADRAKRIVNHAVINEDPNSRVIRELREELEKLRQALLSGGGVGGRASGKELAELQEKLKISQTLMDDMTKTWEQKLLETEKIHQQHQQTLENMGISVQEAGIGVQVDKFYLVNLNADPSMNELLVCYLKDKTRIGRPAGEVAQDIQLRGLGIANEHCIVEIVDREVFITPIGSARTLVNGQPVKDKVPVRHGGRILLGNNHLFRLSCPRPASGGETLPEQDNLMDYEDAMKEISLNELTNDPVYSKMQQELSEKHKAEKEDALMAQRVKYEEQLARLKEQLESSSTSPTPPLPRPPRITTLEEEWEQRNRERLMRTVLQANRLVQEANMLAEALHKDTLFKTTLTIPKSFLSPRQKIDSEDMSSSNEVAIRVLHKQRGTDSVWDLDTLAEKVLAMRDMYERLEEGGPILDENFGPDPFYDLEQHALLGVANFFLDCLHHMSIAHSYSAPIVAPTGKECGRMRVTIERIPNRAVDSDAGDEVDVAPEHHVIDDAVTLNPGELFTCQITVVEATGLPKEYSHYVFCQYQFGSQVEPIIIPPLVHSGHDKLPDRVQKFDHTQTFSLEASEELVEMVENGALAVEVWGHRRSGFMEVNTTSSEENETKKTKSFPERWSELTQQLELWVEIMELNDQGEYVPVEMQTKTDVQTGGIFLIRQGQSRRVNVWVRQRASPGTTPLKCDHISSINMGSVYLRNRYDEPLSSWQEHDLERLRVKWSDALMNRREFLDAEVRKMMDKRDPSVADLEKQNELLDQWAMLQWQRAAVLQPKAGSGVPGAPTNWGATPGLETKVPVLFLDLNDDLQSEDGAANCGGQLFGEKPDTMVELPTIRCEDKLVKATASWDSTVHDTNSLNKLTGSNDRVYAILKVCVALSHPPGLELVLRKRICLRVYKRMSFGASLLRAIAGRDPQTSCGVMYELVMGIPKSAGMQPPPKIPANPSFVELDEDENAVEKFKTAMASISSILSLDRLKQDVSLKEKLTVSGKTLRKKYTVGDVTPQSLSRADSGIIFAGSRAETPEPMDESEEPVSAVDQQPLMMRATTEEATTEEAITVGWGGDVSLGNGQESDVVITIECTPPEEDKCVPEEALGVGTEVWPHTSQQDDDKVIDSVLEDTSILDTIQEKNKVLDSIPEETASEERTTTGVGVEVVETQPLADESPPEPETSHDISETLQDPESSPRRFSEGDILDPKETVRHKPPLSPLHHGPGSTPNIHHVKRDTSPAPSTESESSTQVECKAVELPPCAVGERVMVEIANGFKIGIVKFIGETEFAPGEWIGVALERPNGKHNGMVKGVKYFKCKDKHGVFVRKDKIVHEPSVSSSPRSSSNKSPSPLSTRRKSPALPPLRTSLSARRSNTGGRRT